MSHSQSETSEAMVAPDFLAFSPSTPRNGTFFADDSTPASPGVDERQPLLGLAHSSRKKPFYRARPLWLVPFAILAAVVKGMTIAPRVQVYTQLACDAIYHDGFNHSTTIPSLSISGSSPHSYNVYVPTLYFDTTISHNKTGAPPMAFSDCLRDPLVQAKTARLQTTITTTMGLLSALTNGWWGRFGERYGRTTVLATATLGWLLTDLTVVFASMSDMPWSSYAHRLLLIAPIFEGAFGGWATLQSATTAYISDCTSSGSRAKIFSSFTGVFYIGLSFGPIIGSWLIKYPLWPFDTVSEGSVTHVFYISIMVALLNLLLLLLVFPESLSKEKRARAKQLYIDGGRDAHSTNAKQPPLLRRLLSSLSVFRPRRVADDNGILHKDWSLTFVACALFGYFLAMGVFQLKYLYAEHVYGWGAEQLSYYVSFTGGTRAVYLLFILPFIISTFKASFVPKKKPAPSLNRQSIHGPHRPLPKLIIPPIPPPSKTSKPNSIEYLNNEMAFDLRVIRTSFLVDLLSQLLVVVAPAPAYHAHALGNMNERNSQTLFVLASSLSSFASGATPAIQSLALCILQTRALRNGDVEPVDSGELFGAFAVIQALGSMILGPLIFGVLYSSTVATHPKAIFVTAAVMLVLSFACMLLVRPQRMSRKSKGKRRQVDERETPTRGRSRVSKDLRKDSLGSGYQQSHVGSSSYTGLSQDQ